MGTASDGKARRNSDAGSSPKYGKGFFFQSQFSMYGVRTVPVCFLFMHASTVRRTLKKTQALAAIPCLDA